MKLNKFLCCVEKRNLTFQLICLKEENNFLTAGKYCFPTVEETVPR